MPLSLSSWPPLNSSADTAMALLRDTGSWSASVSTTGFGRVLRTENFHATVCVWFEPMARRDE